MGVRDCLQTNFRRFSRLFWPIFDLNLGGSILLSILPPKFKSKIDSKEPEKRLKLRLWTVSYARSS